MRKERTNNQETMSSNSNTPKDEEKRIDVLFSKFAAFYGHVWRSQFKDELFFKFAKKEWKKMLSQFSDAVLTQATMNCLGAYELPPTLAQLINCCKQITKQRQFYVVKEENAPVNHELRAFHLKKCKEILSK